MRENAAILKGFRMFRELSGNLMICAHSRITPLSEKPAADWSHVLASDYRSSPHGRKTGFPESDADPSLYRFFNECERCLC
jgi:hypothetical protein